MEKYELTEAHKRLLKPWAEKWIANAMSTIQMTEEEREICRKAVKGLYESAGLTPPPDHRIVFVPSPFVMRFAAGFASAIWYLRKNPSFKISDATRAETGSATRDATYAATSDATYAATGAATRDATDDATSDAIRSETEYATRDATIDATCDATSAATYDATCEATRSATGSATSVATYDATRETTSAATRAETEYATSAATRDATNEATRAATLDATRDATRAAIEYAIRAAIRDATHNATDDATSEATRAATLDATYNENKSKWFNFDIDNMVKLSFSFGLGQFGLRCAYESWSMWQGGNQWSAWDSFLTFFRYVAKINIDYSKYDHWEVLSLHSGPRIIHPEFCMISDRPTILKVNSRNQPHCYDGPFCQWSDGTALYSINGVRVPQWVAETKPEQFTREMITKEKNADVRREIIRKIGNERLVKLLEAKTIDSKDGYELISFNIGDGRIRPFLKMKNPSIDAIHIEGVPIEITTVHDALNWRNGIESKEYIKPLSLS